VGCDTWEGAVREGLAGQASCANAGRRVCGVDFAPAMLDLARQRMPEETWIQDDMRSLALGKRFAAIIGWDNFFHLSPVEQRAVLPRLRDHLEPGGGLLLTIGPRAGGASRRGGRGACLSCEP
jgi:trans-aconitate methyltransferase